MKPNVVVRARILGGLFIVLATLLVTRLYFVQVVHGAEYMQEGTAQYIQTDPDTEGRGSIYFTTKNGALACTSALTRSAETRADKIRASGASFTRTSGWAEKGR